MSTPRVLRMVGTLDPPVAVAEDPLLEMVRRAKTGADVGSELAARFRAATLWVEVTRTRGGHEVTAVHQQDLAWLPVFTSLDHLAAFAAASGRGNEPCAYGTLSGAEVLDAVLPALPPGTGLVLDPGAEHVLALPPHLPVTDDEGADDGA